MAQPVSDVVYDIEQYSPRSGRVIGEDEQIYNIVDLLGGGSGGTTNHAALSNLGFEASGHTGFASAVALQQEISNRELAISEKQGQIEELQGEIQAADTAISEVSTGLSGLNTAVTEGFQAVNGEILATNATLGKTNEALWGYEDPITREWMDGVLQSLQKELEYNAIMQLDVTATPALPSLPRARYWHIAMLGDLQGSYDYDRYFYLSAGEAHDDDISVAVARWRIDGQRVYFEYLDNGIVTETVDLTDVDGSVLLETYRPIADAGVVWFFGPNHGASAFPDNDNIRSILDINVTALYTIIGDSFQLATESKQLVGAINELFGAIGGSDSGGISNLIISDEETLENVQGSPNSLAVTPYEIGAWKLNTTARGFECTSTDPRFNGIWVDIGVNAAGTVNGNSLGTHIFMHESEQFVLVWSSWNANPNVPRAGYWFINNATTPRLDNSALVRLAVTAYAPADETITPPDTATMQWVYHESQEPTIYGFERHFNLHSTPDGKAYVGENELARVMDLPNIPTAPTTGDYVLSVSDGVISWIPSDSFAFIPDRENRVAVLNTDDTWTAEADGFVQRSATITHPSTTFAIFRLYQNGVIAWANEHAGLISTGLYEFTSETIPVKAGDVILTESSGSNITSTLYFIPPRR